MKYRCKYFVIQEWVTPEIYKQWGQRAWEFLDSGILITADQLHERFGPVTINNWHTGGEFHESGLRNFDTPTGAKMSQHKFGRAGDFKFKNTTPLGAASVIMAQPAAFPFLTTLEDWTKTVTWLHGDTRNTDQAGIWVVQP